MPDVPCLSIVAGQTSRERENYQHRCVIPLAQPRAKVHTNVTWLAVTSHCISVDLTLLHRLAIEIWSVKALDVSILD